MVTIRLLGMDSYQAIDVTKKVHKKLVNAYGISENDLVFFAPEGFIIHNGVEQTSFYLDIEVIAPEQFESLENEIKDILVNGLQDIAIHFHIIFRYFNPEHEYLITNDDYPLYMTETNVVKVDDSHEEEKDDEDDYEEGEEPYMGDIISAFDDYIKEHPNASNKEVYDALMNIRDDVTVKHQNDSNK